MRLVRVWYNPHKIHDISFYQILFSCDELWIASSGGIGPNTKSQFRLFICYPLPYWKKDAKRGKEREIMSSLMSRPKRDEKVCESFRLRGIWHWRVDCCNAYRDLTASCYERRKEWIDQLKWDPLVSVVDVEHDLFYVLNFCLFH